jgi:hypothetical protein
MKKSYFWDRGKNEPILPDMMMMIMMMLIMAVASAAHTEY